jgi:streptomycin 6-kinase
MSDERLNKYMTKWQLSDAVHYDETHTSQIYVVTYQEKPAILKLLHADETEEKRSAIALRYFNGHGAVQLYRSDPGAQLLEYAFDPELATLVRRDQDEDATHILAGVIRELHSVPQDKLTDGLIPLPQWFRTLFTQADSDQQNEVNSIYIHGALIAEKLLAAPQDIRVLHGDVHHYNIRQSERGWLAFHPKGLVGERTYDCVNALCNPAMTELAHNKKRLLRNAEIFVNDLDLEKQRILDFTFAYCCLNASQWIGRMNGEKFINWYLKIARMIEDLID